MKIFFAITILITSCIIACNSTKKITPSTIGFVTLHNYVLSSDTPFKNDVSHLFIGSETDFRKVFTMTRTSEGSAIIPDFSTQSIVAVILKSTEKVLTVDVTKAQIAGNVLNIYYSVTDTTSFKNYTHTPMVVAIVPKSTGVKQVSFYSNNTKTTIPANY